MENKKTAKPKFELVTDDSSRARCMRSDEAHARCASITSRRVTIMRQAAVFRRRRYENGGVLHTARTERDGQRRG